MTEIFNWQNMTDITMKYNSLEKNQGLRIYYKTINFNTGKEHIIAQIIPYGFDYDYINEILTPSIKSRMSKYVNETQFITWHIYNNEFTICLDDIVQIEIIDNAIDEILKQEGLL